MKIKDIRAVPITFPDKPHRTKPTRPWYGDAESEGAVTPMSRYPQYKAHRRLWAPSWEEQVACVVTAEDGTWGLGVTSFPDAVNPIINKYFASILVGEDCMATEKAWDMMYRLASAYSAQGLASYATSAVDLALWDLKGKLLKKPVYELLGGPVRDKIYCYSTGHDTDWHLELGFTAVKIPCPGGPVDGLAGLETIEEAVSKTRELVGPSVDVMLDCWMGLNVEFAVRLAERLRPYGLKWLEDCLIPEDYDGFVEMRKRLPWQNLATGEHWYTPLPFFSAATKHVVDILQPDIQWVGGVTALVKVCHIAEAAGISVIPHAGMNTVYGQHVVYAMPGIPWGEYCVLSEPGVPLTEATHRTPGVAVPENGYIVPNDAPGFGLELTKEVLEAAANMSA